MRKSIWDVAVIGAGASGLLAAIISRRAGLNVLVLEGKKEPGAKILMSGGSRCNITNLKVSENDYAGGNPRAVGFALKAFPPERTVEFFESLGVGTVAEEEGKVFPSSGSAGTVLKALLGEVKSTGVVIELGRKVAGVLADGPLFAVRGEDFCFSSRSVVLCTGGLSYPSTGCDGSGYRIARSFGHRLVPTTPALTPLTTDDAEWKSLAGISLPVRLSLWAGRQQKAHFDGAMLFTHSGFSGPVVLDVSRYWIREKRERSAVLRVNFLPGEKDEDFRGELIRSGQKSQGGLLRRSLSGRFPVRLCEMILKKAGIPCDLALSHLDREKRELLIRTVFHSTLPVIGALGYDKAEVTAGGVDWNDVNSKTLESRLRTGLFFAGEVLDVDGRIGGFNLQWAWSSGFAAARGVVRRLHHGGTLASA